MRIRAVFCFKHKRGWNTTMPGCPECVAEVKPPAETTPTPLEPQPGATRAGPSKQ